jgi:hypothetical protein
MDCVVTVVRDSLSLPVCEMVGPSATRLPLISNWVVLLTFEFWAASDSAKANAVRMQRFTIPG